jgi:transposase-like protein
MKTTSDRTVFSEDGVDIIGIESFWSYARRRHQTFNGLSGESVPAFLKETEVRFNAHNQGLCRILLSSCRMKPLGR